MLLVSKHQKTILLKVKTREALLLVDPIDNHTKGRGHLEGPKTVIITEVMAGEIMSGEGLVKGGRIGEMTEIVGGIGDGLDLGLGLDRMRGEGGVDPLRLDHTEIDMMIGIIKVIAEIVEAEALETTIDQDMNQEEVTEAMTRSKEGKRRKFILTFSRERRLLTKMIKRSFGMASSG